MSTPYNSSSGSEDNSASSNGFGESSLSQPAHSDQFGSQSFGQAEQPAYGQTEQPAYGQQDQFGGQAFGQPDQQAQFGQPAFGQPDQPAQFGGQAPYGQQDQQAFGQPGQAPYGQPGQPAAGFPGQPGFGQAPVQPQGEGAMTNFFDLSFTKDRTMALAKIAYIFDLVAIGVLFLFGLLSVFSIPAMGGDMMLLVIMYLVFAGFFSVWAVVGARRITEWFVNSSRNATAAARAAAAIEQDKEKNKDEA